MDLTDGEKDGSARRVLDLTASGVSKAMVVLCFGHELLVMSWLEHPIPWYKKKTLTLQKNMTFMYDSNSTDYLERVFARHWKIMQ